MPASLLSSLNVLRATRHGHTSYSLSVPGSRPVPDAIRRSAVPLHSRGVTEPGPSTTTPSCHTGDVIAFFEDKSLSLDNSSRSYSPFGHRRTGSVPAGPRSPSPYTQTSQSIPTFTTTYGYGSSNSPIVPQQKSRSYASTSSRSFLSPPPHTATLRGPTLGSKVPTCQAKLLPTQTHLLLRRMVLPMLAPQPKVHH